MRPRNRSVKLGRFASLLVLPLLAVIGALSMPYVLVAGSIMAHRERRFARSMKTKCRTMEWAYFYQKISEGQGTLMIERFSLKGPTRMWWTEEDVYSLCPYPTADWFTMAKDSSFDAVREWCGKRYTDLQVGTASFIVGTKEQWRGIRSRQPRAFKDGIRYLEMPPPRKTA